MDGHLCSLDRRSVLAGFGAGVAALSGCASASGRAAASHLRIGTIQPPVTLDPVVARGVGSAQAVARVFDGLYTYGTGTDVVPQMAAGPPSVDGSGDGGGSGGRGDGKGGPSVTVELDRDARFHDGEPATPTDVRYSFLAPQRERTAPSWAVSPVEAVEVVDDRTVRLVLARPYPGLAHALTRPVVPKHAREADREAFASAPVGSGPFRVESFDEEKRVALSRWDDYWGKPAPALDAVSLFHVEKPITQLTSLVSDRTDAIEPISPRFRADVESLSGAVAAERAGFRSLYLGFNLNEGPTTDRAVREGVVRCLDVEEAVSKFVEPEGERLSSTLPRRVATAWDFPTDEWAASIPSKDVERAKRSFADAEASVGTLRILSSKHPVWREFAEALAAGLRDAGQSALVDAVGWGPYQERSVSGAESDYSMFVGEVAGTGDPDSFLYPVFHENAEGLTNGVFYHREDVMNPLLSARQTTDRGERKSLYESAVGTLLSERVFLPLSSFHNSFAHERSLRNFRVHPIAQLNPRLTSPDGAATMGAAGGGGGL